LQRNSPLALRVSTSTSAACRVDSVSS
jgi:hypothetical protein